MKFLKKSWWLFAVGFLLIGGILVGIGWGLGANGKYVRWDKDGLRVGECREHEISEFGIEAFTKINVSTVSARVELIPSDRYGVEAKLSECAEEVEWSVEGGRLMVGGDSWEVLNIMNFNFSAIGGDYFVKVYYPEGVEMDEVLVSTTSGDVGVARTIVKNIDVETVSGRIGVEVLGSRKISLESTSGSIDLIGDLETVAEVRVETVSGSVVISDLGWNSLDVETVSGAVEVSGRASGQSNISTVSGSVALRIDGRASDFSYDIESMSGSVLVNDRGMGHSANYESWGTPEDRRILVETVSGGIRLDFSE